jgi:hypothetical protein
VSAKWGAPVVLIKWRDMAITVGLLIATFFLVAFVAELADSKAGEIAVALGSVIGGALGALGAAAAVYITLRKERADEIEMAEIGGLQRGLSSAFAGETSAERRCVGAWHAAGHHRARPSIQTIHLGGRNVLDWAKRYLPAVRQKDCARDQCARNHYPCVDFHRTPFSFTPMSPMNSTPACSSALRIASRSAGAACSRPPHSRR